MPRERDPFWKHVVPQDDDKNMWKCTFCGKDFHAGATRIKAHLGGVRGRGIQVCEKVNDHVREEAWKALLSKKVTGSSIEGPSKKRREGNIGAALNSTSDLPYVEGGTKGPMDISSWTPTHVHSHVLEGGTIFAGSSSSQGDLRNIMPTYRLNEKNYLNWSQLVMTYLKFEGKLSHLLETGPKKGDPDFDAWDKADSMIKLWLWNSMEPAINYTCMLLPTAKEIWDSVRRTYSKAHVAQEYEIKVKTSGTKQEGSRLKKEEWTC